jgi:RecT family protein
MSATIKKPFATQEHEAPPIHLSTKLLDEIVTRMDTMEAKQSRPSPIHLRSWEEIERFAEKAARSGMVPQAYQNKPDMIVIAVQMGSELGLPPMQALQNIAVIQGRPAVFGDAMPALCRASGMAKSIREWSKGEGDALTYYCEAIRKDDPNPVTGKFSVADAKKANLWGKTGPWTQYAGRMLQMRARGFCLRDAFPDVLRGLISAEEASDIPFEATGLQIRPDPEQIMQPIEPPKTKRTWGHFLDELDLELANAKTDTEVDEILARPEVQKAQDILKNGARDRLQTMLDAAIKRTSAPASDETEWAEEEDTGGAPTHEPVTT